MPGLPRPHVPPLPTTTTTQLHKRTRAPTHLRSPLVIAPADAPHGLRGEQPDLRIRYRRPAQAHAQCSSTVAVTSSNAAQSTAAYRTARPTGTGSTGAGAAGRPASREVHALGLARLLPHKLQHKTGILQERRRKAGSQRWGLDLQKHLNQSSPLAAPSLDPFHSLGHFKPDEALPVDMFRPEEGSPERAHPSQTQDVSRAPD